MKMLLFIKIGVVLMTLLILAGLTLIAFKITDNAQKHKAQNQPPLSLLENEQVTQLTGCGQFACLLTEINGKSNRLLMIKPETGRLHQQISLKNE